MASNSTNTNEAEIHPVAAAALTGWPLIGAWITFVMVSISARSLGTVFPLIGLPLITGYLVVGSVAGPFVLGLIQKSALPPLSIVTQCALAFISFSAGSELYLPELRSLFKRILYATTSITFFTFILCTLIITGLADGSGMVAWMEDLSLGCRMSIATIAAAIMCARSPASAIAVVKELKAKGVFTSTILGITVLGDVYVLMLFTLTTTIAESECKGEGFSAVSLGITIGVILVSILLGWFVGYILLALMNSKRLPGLRYLILPLGLLIFVFCHWFTDYSLENLPYVINLEPLLICITAGYVCTNRSAHRHRFISVLQQAGPNVFLPFFTLTGASLDLQVMIQSFGFAAVIALVRAICIFLGSSTGGYLAGVKPYTNPSNTSIWMCLLTQAGVSLGLASEIGMSFPGWGRAFQTAIIGIVLVNQIVGPILFKIAVRKMGEAGKAVSNDEQDEDAIIPTALVIGKSADTLLLTARLLKQHWNVTLICDTDEETNAAKTHIDTYCKDIELQKASVQEEDHHHHGKAKKKMEEFFSTATLGTIGETDNTVRFAKLIEIVPNARNVAAIIYGLPNDNDSLAAAHIVSAIIKTAPKRSTLHSVRQLALLNYPSSSNIFQSVGIMPFHSTLHGSQLVSALVSAPRGRAVTILAGAGTTEEMAKNVGNLNETSSLWSLGSIEPGQPIPNIFVMSSNGSKGNSIDTDPSTVAKSSSFRNRLQEAIQGEDVGEWAGARDEYIDSLHGLDENIAGSNVPTVNKSKNNIEDVAMFGFIGSQGNDENSNENGNEKQGKEHGLAGKDQNQGSSFTQEWA